MARPSAPVRTGRGRLPGPRRPAPVRSRATRRRGSGARPGIAPRPAPGARRGRGTREPLRLRHVGVADPGVRRSPARGDGPPSEAYASELPDLSGPVPRPRARKPAPERGSAPAETAGKSRPGAPDSRAESREERDSRVQVSRRGRGPVRASMQIRRIDPWSTLKVSLLLSVALFFVWMIAVAFLYLVLGGMGCGPSSTATWATC